MWPTVSNRWTMALGLHRPDDARCGKIICVLSTIVLAVLLCSVTADALELIDSASVRRESLPGVKSFSIRVDILVRDDSAYGITAKELETEIEAKFRQSNFVIEDCVVDCPGKPIGFLDVMVNPLEIDGSIRAYAVQVTLSQRISLTDPEKHFLARIWGNDFVRAATSASELRELIDRDVELLLSDLSAVNPKEEHPLPTSTPDPRPAAPSMTCVSPSPEKGRAGLRVFVKDEWDLTIPSASVELAGTDHAPRQYRVGHDGFTSVTGKPGIWHVEVAAAEYNSKDFDFEVPADKACSTTVYLPDSTFRYSVANSQCADCGSRAAVIVRVTDQSGVALPTVIVEVGSTERATAANGEARFDDLQPGKYVIRFRLAGFDAGQIPIRAVAGRQLVATAKMTLRATY
jgi:hypothetical protein